MEWQQEDAFQKPSLEVIEYPPQHRGCGNPWNMMTDEEDKIVRALKPTPVKVPCKIDTMLYVTAVERDKLAETVLDCLGGDIWGPFHNEC